MTNHPKENQTPSFHAILIGGPNDGETFGVFKRESVIFTLDRTAMLPVREYTKPEPFGPKPKIVEYVLMEVRETAMLNSKVLTYFFNKVVQEPYD